jgi:hypothetical protein
MGGSAICDSHTWGHQDHVGMGQPFSFFADTMMKRAHSIAFWPCPLCFSLPCHALITPPLILVQLQRG